MRHWIHLICSVAVAVPVLALLSFLLINRPVRADEFTSGETGTGTAPAVIGQWTGSITTIRENTSPVILRVTSQSFEKTDDSTPTFPGILTASLSNIWRLTGDINPNGTFRLREQVNGSYESFLGSLGGDGASLTGNWALYDHGTYHIAVSQGELRLRSQGTPVTCPPPAENTPGAPMTSTFTDWKQFDDGHLTAVYYREMRDGGLVKWQFRIGHTSTARCSFKVEPVDKAEKVLSTKTESITLEPDALGDIYAGTVNNLRVWITTPESPRRMGDDA